MRPLSPCLTASPWPSTLTPVRPSERATSGATTTIAPPPSVITQQSRRCSGSAIIGEYDDLLDGHDVAQEGVGVVLGVQRRRHLDLGQLLGGRAELVAVAGRGQGVAVDHDHAPELLEGPLGGAAGRGRRRPARRPRCGACRPGRSAPPCTLPAAMAAAAWPRWNRYDEPPVSVESR